MFEALGRHHVKNIAEPITVYRVLTNGTQSRPFVVKWLYAIRRHRATTVDHFLVALSSVVQNRFCVGQPPGRPTEHRDQKTSSRMSMMTPVAAATSRTSVPTTTHWQPGRGGN